MNRPPIDDEHDAPQAFRQAADPGPRDDEPKRSAKSESPAQAFARLNGYENRPLEPKRKRKSVSRNPVTQAAVEQMKSLRAAGKSYRCIAAETGIKLATVGWYLNPKREQGTPQPAGAK